MNVDIKAHNRMFFFLLENANIPNSFRIATGIGLLILILRIRRSHFHSWLLNMAHLYLQNFEIPYLGSHHRLWWRWCPWHLRHP